MRLGVLSSLLIVFLFSSCATVPDDAPQAFHDANASLERLDESDADEIMPVTVERANDTFDEAIDLLEESRENQMLTTEYRAIDKANEAKQAADGAYTIQQKVMSWDKNQSQFQDALAMIEAGPDALYETPQISPFAKLDNSEVVSTVAYFDTNESKNPTYNQAELDSLAKILEKDDSWSVVLTGFADQRGPASYNMKLAMDRAETVAKHLRDRGISDSQIIYQTVGEEQAMATSGHPAKLQLDRKVQAKLLF